MTRKLLIVEDDAGLNQMLALHFEDHDFEVTGVTDCAAARAAMSGATFDLVLLDQQLPDGLGIELLPVLLGIRPDTPLIMMTGQHDLELAIEAIKLGASDFIHKPVKLDTLQTAVRKALARHAARPREHPPQAGAPVRDLVGRSEPMLEVSKAIALAAGNQATVLIRGESGTGKEVVARLIHEHGGRGGPFVAVNCAAIVDNLLESELFGHEKGAFTGADRAKPGKFELAGGGTLFLDEIGELALPLQAKLLRALQERRYERVGGTRTREIDARILAATHRDLMAGAAEGWFREDLAYRLSVVTIKVPPLRERREDIPLLVASLLDRAAGESGTRPCALQDEAMQKLCAHAWPGNVRELLNVLTQASIHARGGAITAADLPIPGADATTTAATQSQPIQVDPLRTLEEVEAEHIQRVLDHTGGHKGKSCAILGISRPALDRKIGRYGLHLPGR